MHDHARLLHMHAAGVCDSNFLCSFCVCVWGGGGFGRKLVLCEPMLMMNLIWPRHALWLATKYVPVRHITEGGCEKQRKTALAVVFALRAHILV